MSLMAPGPTGFDVRTFQCSNGHRVDIAMAEDDPMKSDAIRWLAAYDLKSPD
jgi:hypothetical protein